MVWTLDPFDGVGRKNIVLDSAVNIANDEEMMRSSNSMWELGSRFVISEESVFEVTKYIYGNKI